eukprot:Hpha_TRINITY_DN25874_c0_g1::TRINITY_DN25874_c0_g1_i1::g.20020::m.20020
MRLPSVPGSSYSLCYSSSLQRASLPGAAPGWRFIPSSLSPESPLEGGLVVDASPHRLTWTLDDTTRGSFATLRVQSTLPELRRTPAWGGFGAALSGGGDQVRLVSTADLLPGGLGCFTPGTPGSGEMGDWAGRDGPSETRHLRPDPATIPADLQVAEFIDPSPVGQHAGWAFLRVPEWDGGLGVCYRPAGKNWRQVGAVLMPSPPELNATWEAGDTRADSYGTVTVHATTNVLSDAPPPAPGAVQVKLVGGNEGCATSPPREGAGTEDTGAAELLNTRSWNETNLTVNRSSVVAYLRMPSYIQGVQGGYRVCLRHGWRNWVEIPRSTGNEWFLTTSPPSDVFYHVSDPRARVWGTILLSSNSHSLDLRPTVTASGLLVSGTMVRLVPNTTETCVPTLPDPFANQTVTDLGMWCRSEQDAGCAGRVGDTFASDIDGASGGFVQLRFPDPPAGVGLRVCFKVGGRNWVEAAPGLLELEPPTLLRASPLGGNATSGTRSTLRVYHDTGPLPTKYDVVKLVPSASTCLATGLTVSHELTPFPWGSQALLLLPPADLKATYQVCYLFSGRVGWVQVG